MLKDDAYRPNWDVLFAACQLMDYDNPDLWIRDAAVSLVEQLLTNKSDEVRSALYTLTTLKTLLQARGCTNSNSPALRLVLLLINTALSKNEDALM